MWAALWVASLLLSSVRAADIEVIFLTVAKGEAAYIDEWVTYHSILGIDSFVLASNECDDAADAALKEAATGYGARTSATVSAAATASPLDGRAIVFVDDFRCSARGFQKLAYRRLTTSIWRWVAPERRARTFAALVDVDEFFALPPDVAAAASLSSALASALDERETAWAVRTNVFGSSFRAARPAGGVLANYVMRARAKGLATPRGADGAGFSIASPHFDKMICRVDILEDKSVPPSIHACVAVEDGSAARANAKRSRRAAVRINHFTSKSDEEWAAKVKRGRATTPRNRTPGAVPANYSATPDISALVTLVDACGRPGADPVGCAAGRFDRFFARGPYPDAIAAPLGAYCAAGGSISFGVVCSLLRVAAPSASKADEEALLASMARKARRRERKRAARRES